MKVMVGYCMQVIEGCTPVSSGTELQKIKELLFVTQYYIDRGKQRSLCFENACAMLRNDDT